MLARSDWIVPSPRNRWGRKVKIAHHFTAPFDTRANAVREHGTYGGRRQSRQAWGRRRLCCLRKRSERFDVDQRRRLRSCGWIMSSVLTRGRGRISPRLRPPETLVAFFLSPE